MRWCDDYLWVLGEHRVGGAGGEVFSLEITFETGTQGYTPPSQPLSLVLCVTWSGFFGYSGPCKFLERTNSRGRGSGAEGGETPS